MPYTLFELPVTMDIGTNKRHAGGADALRQAVTAARLVLELDPPLQLET